MLQHHLTYPIWLGASLRLTQFTLPFVLLALLIGGLLAGAAAWRWRASLGAALRGAGPMILLSEGVFLGQTSCPVGVLAAVAAPAAPTSRVSDPRHASSNDMVSQENCGHGINGARSANTCAALMKHRARRVAPGGVR